MRKNKHIKIKWEESSFIHQSMVQPLSWYMLFSLVIKAKCVLIYFRASTLNSDSLLIVNALTWLVARISEAFADSILFFADELKEHLIGEHTIDRIFTLGNSEFPVSWDNEVKLWTFLEARASLLLKTYKTTIHVRLKRTWNVIYL